MADNVELNTGTGGAICATDDVGGVQYQVVKLDVGADGVSAPVSNSNPVPVSDAGGALTVDGTVAVTHAALTELAAAINASSQMDCNVAASALPTGAATSAKQDTIIGHLDGVEALLGTIDTNVATVAGAVSGTEMQVDVVAALPAGNNNIGDVDIASIAAGDNNIGNVDIASIAAGDNNIGNVDVVTLPALPAGNNNIGDVDVASIVPGTGATNLGKAEDGIHSSGDVGVMMLAVRQDSQSALAADGDYLPPTIDGNGGLRVSIVAGAGSGGTAAADDADFTAGTTQGTPAMGVYESTPTTVTDGDLGTVGILANRQVKVTLFDSAGVEQAVGGGTQYTEDAAAAADPVGNALIMVRDDALSGQTTADGDNVAARGTDKGELYVKHVDAIPVTDNGGALTVDGTVTANLAAGTNNIGDVDILSIAAGDNNIGNVDIVTMPNVTLAAGTNTNEVVGDIAHDTGVGGNPVQIAGAAQDMDDTAPPNRVSAESDVTRIATDRDGAIFAHPHGPQVWSYHSDGSSALTDATVHAAPGAGLSLYVTDIVISTGAATALNAFFEEGASKVLGPYYLEAVAGRGCVVRFLTPKKITANTALTVTTSAAIAQCVDVTGFIAPG